MDKCEENRAQDKTQIVVCKQYMTLTNIINNTIINQTQINQK